MALAEYNKDPYSLDTHDMTFGEAAQKYMEDQRPKVKDGTYNNYKVAFNQTKALHDRPMVQLKLDTLQLFVDTCGKSYIALSNIKRFFVSVFNWAIKYEVVQKNYGTLIDVEKHKASYTKRKKAVFSPDEIRTLWNMADTDKTAEMLVLMLYTGVRISEAINLETKDVDLEKKCFYVRKSKTAAGVRTVPIADCIMPILQRNMGSQYVINLQGRDRPDCQNIEQHIYPLFRKRTGLDHTLHETRHTFISMLADAGVDERITKSIVGHQGGSITESVYTHISLQPMLDAVNMLPVYK